MVQLRNNQKSASEKPSDQSICRRAPHKQDKQGLKDSCAQVLQMQNEKYYICRKPHKQQLKADCARELSPSFTNRGRDHLSGISPEGICASSFLKDLALFR